MYKEGATVKHAEHAKKSGLRRLPDRMVRAASLCLAGLCLAASIAVYPSANAATSMSSLQNKLDQLSDSIKQHQQELSDAKKKEAAAKALESELKEKVEVLQSQISVLKSQIASVQNSIGVKEQEIAAKEAEIAAKEAEIAQKEVEIEQQWSDFKQHMAAMQELRDGGSVAMLSSVHDLYELLTFNEVMQDISVKDTEIMDAMKAAKEEMQNQKAELETQRTQLQAQRAELQSRKADLDAQNAQMKAKQSELNASVSAAQLSAEEAQQAQKEAQAAIDSDEMNYEAVKKQIQKLIEEAASKQPSLSFKGFTCPLKSYTRVSSEYGTRKNPVTGVTKLHAGIDLAAPGGTPIYAAASGYVQAAGWSSGGYGNYVVIYHGKMTDGNAYSTLYGHMRSVATSTGKYVSQGELIGYVGSTGNSTGNHLHLEVWRGASKANAVNPRSYIPLPHN